MKKEYKIPYGSETYTRKSERTYTHIVVGTDYVITPEVSALYAKNNITVPVGVTPCVVLLGYAGSRELAEKRAAGWEAKRYAKVEIIEITPDMVRLVKSRKSADKEE